MNEDEPIVRCDDDYADWWEQRSLRLMREPEPEDEPHHQDLREEPMCRIAS